MNEVSLADIAAVTDRNGYGCGNGMWGMEWLFALLILPMMWGGNGPFGRNNAEPVTESGLCNAMNFNNLENAVGRLSDQQNQIAMQEQRDLCTGFANVVSAVNQSRFENQNCCCETQKEIIQNRYEAAQNTGAIIQAQKDSTREIIDWLCGQENRNLRDENMRNFISSQFCGVVRYPLQTTYSTNCNPFFGGGYGYGDGCGRCCGNGNI